MGMIDYETGADSEVFWEAYDVGAEVAETPVKTGEVVTVPMPENYKGYKMGRHIQGWCRKRIL